MTADVYPYEVLPGNPPILHEIAEPQEPGPEAVQMLTRMVLTVMRERAHGLAAPQIGESRRAIVVQNKTTGEYWAMLNPKITSRSKLKVPFKEACLSFPGKVVTKKRNYSCTVEGQTGLGAPMTVTVKDSDASCFQHEIDHLNGITI